MDKLIYKPDAVTDYFRSLGRQVVTFTGYSGSGYEDGTGMLNTARSILSEFDPNQTVINIGATPDGIGEVYKIAKELGFTTTGIVSSQAIRYDPSPFVDKVFYIQDETWGGYITDTNTLSPTSRTMVDVSDFFIAIGGGEITRDELLEARRINKIVRFYPADMNHQKEIETAQAKGESTPVDFSGAAAKEFS